MKEREESFDYHHFGKPLQTESQHAMQWLAYFIGISVILTIVFTAIAAVWTGEWRWLIITVFLVWVCNRSSGAQFS